MPGKNEVEQHILPAGELRVMQMDGQPKKIVGYAAVFDVLSENLGGFRERIATGAFSRALSEGQDVRALWNHESEYVLGRTKNGTLKLEEDSHGLRIEVEPPETMWAADALTSLERGDVDQMSFSFRALSDVWTMEGGIAVRTLKDVDLYDVSPVTFPAYPQTQVSLRALEGQIAALLRTYRAAEPDGQAAPVTSEQPPVALQENQPQAGLEVLRLRLDLEEKL